MIIQEKQLGGEFQVAYHSLQIRLETNERMKSILNSIIEITDKLSTKLGKEIIYQRGVERFGIEYDPHISLVYPLYPNNMHRDYEDILREFLSNYPVKQFDLILNNVIAIPENNPRYDILAIDVKCEELKTLHKSIREHLSAYKLRIKDFDLPHITICYLEDKYAPKVQKVFENIGFIKNIRNNPIVVKELYYNRNNKTVSKIDLG